MKLFFVAGLGYGDEGKGSIVEYLTQRHGAKLIVRYNGGAQAAHNVVYKDQWKTWSHTYAQFGSGTHVGMGVNTYLSRYMLVEPRGLYREAVHLAETCGVSEPLKRVWIDAKALLITPYHIATNRLLELARKAGRHGSCGLGIGQVREEFLTFGYDDVLSVGDIKTPTILRRKLSALRERKIEQIRNESVEHSEESIAAIKLLTTPVSKEAEHLEKMFSALQVVDEEFLAKALSDDQKSVIFEGAQGVLLDESYGFHPHTTWTDITFENIYRLIKYAQRDRNEFDIQRIGVTRTYMTRHGEGPLVTEAELPEVPKHTAEHNTKGTWQGQFRLGHLDLVALKYSVDVLRELDQIALTHMDLLPHLKTVCVRYKDKGSYEKADWITSEGYISVGIGKPSIKEQDNLRYFLQNRTTPIYWPITENLPELISDILKVPVKILSSGPTVEGKREI